MNGPSTWTPSAPGTRLCASRAAASASSQHARRIGHHGRQKTGDARAPMRGRDRSDPFHRRLGVEQHSAAAVDLPIDEAGAENSPAEIVLLAAARAVAKRVSAPIDAPSTTSARSSRSRSPSNIRAPVKTFIARPPFWMRWRRRQIGLRRRPRREAAPRAARRFRDRDRAARLRPRPRPARPASRRARRRGGSATPTARAALAAIPSAIGSRSAARLKTRGAKAPKSPGFASRAQRTIATGSSPNSPRISPVSALAGASPS